MVDSSDGKPPGPPGFEIRISTSALRHERLRARAPVQKPDPFGGLEPTDAALPSGSLGIDELPDIPLAGGAAPSGGLDYFGAGTFDADDFDDALQYGSGALNLAEVPTGGVANPAPETDRWPSGRSPEQARSPSTRRSSSSAPASAKSRRPCT